MLSAILGIGPLTAVVILSSSRAPFVPKERFWNVLRVVGWGLTAMLVTGGLIDAQAHGAFGKTLWIKTSVALFVVLVVVYVLVRRRVKQSTEFASAVPGAVRPLLWTMCTLVAAIAYLMEAKPF
ncbi:MAG: hypothetical protein QM790_16060 [Nibricoccus sp.]